MLDSLLIITGFVLFPSGEPVVGAEVFGYCYGSRACIIVSGEGKRTYNSRYIHNVLTDEDGRYSIKLGIWYSGDVNFHVQYTDTMSNKIYYNTHDVQIETPGVTPDTTLYDTVDFVTPYSDYCKVEFILSPRSRSFAQMKMPYIRLYEGYDADLPLIRLKPNKTKQTFWLRNYGSYVTGGPIVVFALPTLAPLPPPSPAPMQSDTFCWENGDKKYKYFIEYGGTHVGIPYRSQTLSGLFFLNSTPPFTTTIYLPADKAIWTKPIDEMLLPKRGAKIIKPRE